MWLQKDALNTQDCFYPVCIAPTSSRYTDVVRATSSRHDSTQTHALPIISDLWTTQLFSQHIAKISTTSGEHELHDQSIAVVIIPMVWGDIQSIHKRILPFLVHVPGTRDQNPLLAVQTYQDSCRYTLTTDMSVRTVEPSIEASSNGQEHFVLRNAPFVVFDSNFQTSVCDARNQSCTRMLPIERSAPASVEQEPRRQF